MMSQRIVLLLLQPHFKTFKALMPAFASHSISSSKLLLGFILNFVLFLPPTQGALAQEAPLYAAYVSTGIIEVGGNSIDATSQIEDFKLTSFNGSPIELSSVSPNRSNSVLLHTAGPLDPSRLYTLTYTHDGSHVFVSRESWFSSLFSPKALGATVSADLSQTDFRLFAPRASGVTLHLFTDSKQNTSSPDASFALSKDPDGVWEISFPRSYHGVFYTYTIDGPDEQGNFFYGTNPVHITDPYALVSDDSWGKAMVYADGEKPESVRGGRPAMEDVIAYEVHVQDFTDELPVPTELKGTFAAMVMPGLKNERGEPIGFDYLTSLGINTVHLMPVQEFLHYPDNEWQAAFANDPYMIEQGVSQENYQWGYRTTHAFAVELRFRTKNAAIGAEREQFKSLIKAFHEKGISVIIDVVPNHTGENMDGGQFLFNFGAIDRPYYYRTDSELNLIGPFGNEVKSENRPMVQRWILDQLKHWVEELGVDGFRIDLAGQIDKQTLKWIKNELPEDLIIYGEPWIAPSDPVVANDPDLGWYKKDAPITFFQDDARNAFKGPVSNPENPKTDRGFAGGDGSMRERAMQALANQYSEEPTPNAGINYLDIHDNWALADQFSDVDWDGRKHVDEAQFRIAATLLFTSLGPIVLHGGSEMMRSKGHAPLEELIKETAYGKIYLHGKRDTYNLRRANAFVWDNVGAGPDETRPMDYAAMTAFWSGLMHLRSSSIGDVFTIGHAVPDSYFKWILPENPQLLGYVVNERVLVLINTSETKAEFDVSSLVDGSWMQISDGTSIYPDGCDCGTDFDAPLHQIAVSSKTALIWARKE